MKKAEKRRTWKEYPDPTPIEVDAELKAPETIEQKIKRIIATDISKKMAERGEETLEEAEDFDVDDSFDGDAVFSPYEIKDMDREFPAGSPESQESKESGQPEEVDPASLTKEQAITMAEEYRQNKGYYPLTFMERTGLFNDKATSESDINSDTELHGETDQRDKE